MAKPHGHPARATGLTRRRPRPSCRCEQCGYELAGLTDKNPVNPHIVCPECGTPFNTIYPSRLEAWPGDAAARKRMIAYAPYGMAVGGLLAFLVYTSTSGKAGAGSYAIALGIALVLTLGEALVQAWRLAHRCFGRREAFERFVGLAAIGAGLTLAVWLPVILIGAAVAALL